MPPPAIVPAGLGSVIRPSRHQYAIGPPATSGVFRTLVSFSLKAHLAGVSGYCVQVPVQDLRGAFDTSSPNANEGVGQVCEHPLSVVAKQRSIVVK